uniref:PHD finger protein n=1 Tax=Ananas comosus var. bracteatus TaxID=296719 RepID=A0A6V7QW03_ANACO
MTIAEKVSLTKRKMEEAKEVAMNSSVYSSQGTMLHGASRFSLDKTTSPHPEAAHLRFDARFGGPTYLTQARATSVDYAPQKASTTPVQLALAIPAQTSKSVDNESSLLPAPSHAMRDRQLKTLTIQAGAGNLIMGHQTVKGQTYTHPASVAPVFNDISKYVQQILQRKASNPPDWTPLSTEYMKEPLNCQVCKILITDVESLLVCDNCDKGTHLTCLNNYKGPPKGEWHCPKCLTLSHGKPLPPKYGRVTRSTSAPKAASNVVGHNHASGERKTESSDLKSNQQKIIANGNSTVPNAAYATNTRGDTVESSPNTWTVSAEAHANLSGVVMKREGNSSAEILSSNSNDGIVCTNISTRCESSHESIQNNPTESMSVVTTEITKSGQLNGSDNKKANESQAPSTSRITNNTEVESSIKASANENRQVSEPWINELKERVSGKEASEHSAGSHDGLDYGDNHRTTPNGVLESKDEVRDGCRSLLADLHTVDWVGDVLQVVGGNLYYRACQVNGSLYKLQDHVLIPADGNSSIPSKLLASLYHPFSSLSCNYLRLCLSFHESMWEDKGSGSKWAVVNPYYLPHDLPDTVIQPSAAEDSEVYASNIQRKIMADSIRGPCEVFSIDKFREEREKRSELSDLKSNLHSIFMCKWKYDESAGILQLISS